MFQILNYRLKENFVKRAEDALVEDTKHYFKRDSPSVAKITDENVDITFDDHEYMSPVVSALSLQIHSFSKIIMISSKKSSNLLIMRP